jgi:hypothetical protein|tara:strand:- start:7999 stop:8304 length:306 start_codon:yes stop_codon:yes gene_type:complete
VPSRATHDSHQRVLKCDIYGFSFRLEKKHVTAHQIVRELEKSTKQLNLVETPSLLTPFFKKIMSIDNVLALLMLLMVTIQTICHAVHLAVRHRRVNQELDP